MFGLLFTLSGSILLAVMVAAREEYAIKELTATIVPTKGKVHPRVLEILKETYLFRMGLLYIILGTTLQVLGFDVSVDSINIFIKLTLFIVGTFTLLWVGKKVSFYCAEKNVSTFPPYNPDIKRPKIGEIFLDNDE
ncbi:hypothetical protein [Paenibacillus sp. 481]|uniref:hypothetical protein n=1 Tax=Paenibacillus sp. 481 TaxID=2835869 RepID=UPI001E605345|nr:hypothetical protein [Paenibacillus sp. 481]UHA72051.1 hypothetical protein KIK04_15195 [Paenibacillus sp. 481]